MDDKSEIRLSVSAGLGHGCHARAFVSYVPPHPRSARDAGFYVRLCYRAQPYLEGWIDVGPIRTQEAVDRLLMLLQDSEIAWGFQTLAEREEDPNEGSQAEPGPVEPHDAGRGRA